MLEFDGGVIWPEFLIPALINKLFTSHNKLIPNYQTMRQKYSRGSAEFYDVQREKYERWQRRLRQRIFDYPEHKEEQAARLLKKLKEKIISLKTPFYYDWMGAAE